MSITNKTYNKKKSFTNTNNFKSHQDFNKKESNSMRLKQSSKESLQKVYPKEFCAVVRVIWKKNNVFINITNLRGKTIYKMSAGCIEKRKVKKELRKMLNFMLESVSVFVKANFDSVHILVKGKSLKSIFPVFNTLRYKETPITRLKVSSGVLHNGCRPPKKRRV